MPKTHGAEPNQTLKIVEWSVAQENRKQEQSPCHVWSEGTLQMGRKRSHFTAVSMQTQVCRTARTGPPGAVIATHSMVEVLPRNWRSAKKLLIDLIDYRSIPNDFFMKS